jgi:hypothetical protein
VHLRICFPDLVGPAVCVPARISTSGCLYPERETVRGSVLPGLITVSNAHMTGQEILAYRKIQKIANMYIANDS